MQSRHNIFELSNGFPTRHGTAVFLAGRKLFADSFLLGMAPLCFLPTGKYLRRVSCSAWHHCVSCRQETFSPGDFSTPLEMTWEAWHHCVSCQQKTVREGFPIRLDAIVFQCGRKLFAKGFLFGMAPLCFLPAGNFFAGRFLDSARNDMGGMAPLCFLPTENCSRRVFLFDMTLLCFFPAGNCLLRVSYSTWHYCVSCRQETICERFPTRHGTTVFHRGRKLFHREISRLRSK